MEDERATEFIRNELERLYAGVNYIQSAIEELLLREEDPEREALEGGEGLLSREGVPPEVSRDLWQAEAISHESFDQLNRMQESTGQLAASVDKLFHQSEEENGEEEKRHYALAATSALQALNTSHAEFTAEVDRVAAAQTPTPSPQIQGKAKRLRDWLVNRLKLVITKVSQHLWQIILGMLTPKSWTLGGGVGIPGLANAQISITFGQ